MEENGWVLGAHEEEDSKQQTKDEPSDRYKGNQQDDVAAGNKQPQRMVKEMKSRLRSARFGGAKSSNDAIDISQEPTEPFEEPAIFLRTIDSRSVLLIDGDLGLS